MIPKVARTMTDLIKQKKDLIKLREVDPTFEAAINAQLHQIEKKIESKTSKSDQNFFRTFYKSAKEGLDPETFAKIEGVAGTRQYLHQSKGAAVN